MKKSKKESVLDITLRHVQLADDEIYIHRNDVVTILQTVMLGRFDLKDMIQQIKTFKP